MTIIEKEENRYDDYSSSITSIISRLESYDSYHERPETAVIGVSGELFVYRKRHSKDPTPKSLDQELMESLKNERSFTIKTKLSPAGRFCVLGNVWNAHTERANRTVTVKFKKIDGIHEIDEAIVWSDRFFDDKGYPLADEILNFENGRLKSRSTDLSIHQIIDLIEQVPGYSQRDTKIRLSANGEEFTLLRDHKTPTIPELILATKLRELKFFTLETTLSLGGSIKYLGFNCTIGTHLAGKSGVLFFGKDSNSEDLSLLRFDIFGTTDAFKKRPIYSITRSGRGRNKEKLSTAASIEELIEEIINAQHNDPLAREVRIITDKAHKKIQITSSTRTHLEELLSMKLKELKSFAIEVKIPDSLNCREIQILEFIAQVRPSDGGKVLRLNFTKEHGNRAKLVERNL